MFNTMIYDLKVGPSIEHGLSSLIQIATLDREASHGDALPARFWHSPYVCGFLMGFAMGHAAFFFAGEISEKDLLAKTFEAVARATNLPSEHFQRVAGNLTTEDHLQFKRAHQHALTLVSAQVGKLPATDPKMVIARQAAVIGAGAFGPPDSAETICGILISHLWLEELNQTFASVG